MMAQGVDDCEGELLARVRDIVGADVPVGAILDLHGNVSRPMVGSGENAQGIVDDAWQEVLRRRYTQHILGIVPERLPDLSSTEASRRSAVGTALITRLNKVDAGVLPHDLALSLRLVRFRAKMWAREEQLYWTACDPLGVGFFDVPADRLLRRVPVELCPRDHSQPRALIATRGAGNVIVSGESAGGNLAAAMVLKARDEGIPCRADCSCCRRNWT